MSFKNFKQHFQQHIESLFKDQNCLFMVDADKDKMWNLYLESFRPEDNKLFRERREYDCSCCRHFIKSFGNIVIIKNYVAVNIWDFVTTEKAYQPSINALARYISSLPINNALITKESFYGTDFNYEKLEGNEVYKWDHFHYKLSDRFLYKGHDTVNTIKSNYRAVKEVFKRSLEEINKEAIETILELIAQKSLYKGNEWQKILEQFLVLHNKYHSLSSNIQDNFCWIKSVEIGEAIGKIRNHSIGVLLVDISNNMDLNEAVKRYEKIVAPTNYKRPKAIFTKKMLEEAQKTITELGYLDSLNRRFATIDDITHNNILFANKDVAKDIHGNVFNELEKDCISNPRQFDKVEEIGIEHFIEKILPKTNSIELFIENRLESNFISLIAPKMNDNKIMFKWDNNFSWAYTGNITDSAMRERVRALGGKVEGVLRFSIQWNEQGNNNNDFDAHCIEPNRNLIYFGNKGRRHNSSGMLDVDIIEPKREVISGVAVENIIYTDQKRMPEGLYDFMVHVYSYRNGKDGFRAEIEFDGQIYYFEYNRDVRQDQKIQVASVKYEKEKGFSIVKSLPSSLSTKTIWNVKTNQFHPVSVCMFSPNYWDEQKGMGHKHYFFMLKNCINDTCPNGFFNEFLKEALVKHKRVFEALGSKMKVNNSDNQLSGIGFSSTKRNSVVAKIEGHVSRVLKIIF